MSNLQNFVRLVARMRNAQKNLKKFKGQSYIAQAEQLERDVDKTLEGMGFEGKKIKQLRIDAQAPHQTDEERGPYLTELE